MEEHISIALKMKECRVTAKKIHGDSYKDKLKPYEDILQLVMKSNNIDTMQALHKITQQNDLWNKEASQIMFLAAAVEIIDPV